MTSVGNGLSSFWRIRRPRRSLEIRLLRSFLVLSVVTVGVVGAVAYGTTRRSLANALDAQLLTISAMKEEELNRWIEVQQERLELMAAQPEIRAAAGRLPEGAGVQRLQAMAELVAGDGVDLKAVFVMTVEGGLVVASTAPEDLGDFHATDLFFTEGRSRSMVQEVYPSPDTGQPEITAAVPVRGPDGQPRAVLAAHLNLDRMDQIIYGHRGAGESSQAYLVTGTNEFVSSVRFGLPDFTRGVHSVGIDAAVSGRTGVGLYLDHEGKPVVGAYRWIPARELGLLVEVPQDVAFAPARDLLLRIILSGLAATLILMVGIRWIASGVVRPVVAVGAAAAKVAEGDFSVVAPVEGEDEVGELARSFNTMTERLRDLYWNLQGQVEVTTQTMAALEESRSLLRSIIENYTDLIAVTDAEGRVQLMNHAFLDLLGRRDVDAVGRFLRDLLPEEIREGWLEAKMEAFEERRVVKAEIPWATDQGTRTYLCTWFPLMGDGGRPFGVGMIASDLTERKRAEEERARFETQLRHAQKLESLGVLAGGIAHDFNNILAAILGHTDLARVTLVDDPEEAVAHLDQVGAAAQRAAGLTNQMLAYAGQASFRMERVDLNEAIREMSSLLEVSLPKRVRLITHFSREPLAVQADPAQLSQVVMNLITNAAQAIGEDGGEVELSTGASVPSRGAPRAVLRVRDNGCGMDPETRERIFDPFFSTKETGRGLGLAAVLGIVNGLKGTIEVESEPGEGTTFTVSFPIRDPRGPAPRAVEEDGGEKAPQPGGTVLVVDDEAAVRNFTVRVLERGGFRVLAAEDGLEALKVFEENGDGIDAVVLDLSMPGMGGKEVFIRLREKSPDLPVVFISGFDPADSADVREGTPAVRYLQKPFRAAALVEEVMGLLSDE